MTAFDMTDSIVPKSDQLNAEDLLTGPRTFTVAEVRHGSAEQPVEVVLTEFGPGRPFKPSKTVRRIMVGAWGPDASKYVGRRMTLYRDPTVRFGGQDVGGIRVSHMSHIDKRITIALTVTRGKRAAFSVDPLRDDTPPPPPPSDGITREQWNRLGALFTDAGIKPDAHLDYCRKQIGRDDLTAPSKLTRDEAAAVITALDAMLGPDGTDTPTLDGSE